MRYGIYVPNAWSFASPHDLAKLTSHAEECGWDGFFIWDHLTIGDAPMADAQISLAAIALATKKMKIGTLITPLARRRPWKVARELASLDQLAPGRVVLGAGLGEEDEYNRFSFEEQEPRQMAARLDDALDLLPRLLSGAGDNWEQCEKSQRALGLAEAEKASWMPFQPAPAEQIPIWVAASWHPDNPGFRKNPITRAADQDGFFPVRMPWDNEEPIEPAQFAEGVAAIEAARGDLDGFELIACGRALRDDNPANPSDYEDATWWLEAMTRAQTVDDAMELISKREQLG